MEEQEVPPPPSSVPGGRRASVYICGEGFSRTWQRTRFSTTHRTVRRHRGISSCPTPQLPSAASAKATGDAMGYSDI